MKEKIKYPPKPEKQGTVIGFFRARTANQVMEDAKAEREWKKEVRKLDRLRRKKNYLKL